MFGRITAILTRKASGVRPNADEMRGMTRKVASTGKKVSNGKWNLTST